ncbi:MAG: EF-Tu/IF-2/RF-3 family GTPase, partial [Candidatus Aenigmarchaeota archaeon]|nr:EF-Tu/IF-2/RF-3 family GTPase [Candidatus Aenigmarchaeota archaeon]MDI6722864.1 EF-Tu/IF-2/RF-3 family GTPase [Candidatus Aenigmarchaeota archaeon]
SIIRWRFYSEKEKTDIKELKEKISVADVRRHSEGDFIVQIDNYFDVKGVGTVILGMVKRGTVSQYDKAMLYPAKKEVAVKSIQCNDEDVKSAGAGSRVGLAMKGIEVDDLKRGFVISSSVLNVSQNIQMGFVANKYSKHEISENKPVMCIVGLQAVSGKIKNVSPLSVELDNKIAYEAGQRCLVVSPEKMPRIAGSGAITASL